LGLHNVLDQASAGKYEFVAEATADFERGKARMVTEAMLASVQSPPDVIVAASDEMALGALEALQSRNLQGTVTLIGYDALLEALEQIKAGGLTATIEESPGAQASVALDTLAAFLWDGTKPDQQTILLDPIVITKDNLAEAERLDDGH
jgi:inositol transport system substrate-binding protein